MPNDPGIVVESAPAANVLERWRELRARYDATGLWPVLVRSEGELARFRERWEETREAFDEVKIEGLEPTDRVPIPDDPPGGDLFAAEKSLVPVLDLGEEVWIASFPCSEPAEIPARLLEGGDLCPSPETHLATLKRWAIDHGTEPLFVGQDTLVLLARPVRSLDEAERLAVEHVDYCGESPEEIEEIAPHLVGLPFWFFWWD